MHHLSSICVCLTAQPTGEASIGLWILQIYDDADMTIGGYYTTTLLTRNIHFYNDRATGHILVN